MRPPSHSRQVTFTQSRGCFHIVTKVSSVERSSSHNKKVVFTQSRGRFHILERSFSCRPCAISSGPRPCRSQGPARTPSRWNRPTFWSSPDTRLSTWTWSSCWNSWTKQACYSHSSPKNLRLTSCGRSCSGPCSPCPSPGGCHSAWPPPHRSQPRRWPSWGATGRATLRIHIEVYSLTALAD